MGGHIGWSGHHTRLAYMYALTNNKIIKRHEPYMYSVSHVSTVINGQKEVISYPTAC